MLIFLNRSIYPLEGLSHLLGESYCKKIFMTKFRMNLLNVFQFKRSCPIIKRMTIRKVFETIKPCLKDVRDIWQTVTVELHDL